MPDSTSPLFCHHECPYFPCHVGADPQNFHCLFCYCPLYPLGVDCGGTFSLLPQGGKDCSRCLYPHEPQHYGEIVSRLGELFTRFPPPPNGKQVTLQSE